MEQKDFTGGAAYNMMINAFFHDRCNSLCTPFGCQGCSHIDFILDMLTSDEIRSIYNRKWYAESFYLLAMVDYLSRENSIPICTKYNDLRRQKMQEVIYPASIVIIDDAMKTDSNKKESIRNSIPEFMKFNIVESEVRNVF